MLGNISWLVSWQVDFISSSNQTESLDKTPPNSGWFKRTNNPRSASPQNMCSLLDNVVKKHNYNYDTKHWIQICMSFAWITDAISTLCK